MAQSRPDKQFSRSVENSSFQVSYDLKEVRAVRAALVGLAGQHGFGRKKVRELTLALGEALDNALEHGCKEGGQVRVQFRIHQSHITVVVEDPGNGGAATRPRFEKAKLSEKVGEEDNRGRGLYLIKTVMDQVRAQHLRSGGTRVIMTKYR